MSRRIPQFTSVPSVSSLSRQVPSDTQKHSLVIKISISSSNKVQQNSMGINKY